MRYINAEDVLPVTMLEELRKYVEGEVIYIPVKNRSRAGWGEKNGVRDEYTERNKRIYQHYRQGLCVEQLVGKYNLSESGIRKIIKAQKQKTEIMTNKKAIEK